VAVHVSGRTRAGKGAGGEDSREPVVRCQLTYRFGNCLTNGVTGGQTNNAVLLAQKAGGWSVAVVGKLDAARHDQRGSLNT
jgi:hypothetical protein